MFDDAIHEVVGRDPEGHGVSMGGKTDPQIALEIMDTLRLEDGEAATHLPDVLDALHRRTAEAEREFRTTGGTHPGVQDVLARLAETPGVIQTVLTGNVEPNMRVKLGVFGLDRWLDLEVAATGLGQRGPARAGADRHAPRRRAARHPRSSPTMCGWSATPRATSSARGWWARTARWSRTGRGSDDLRALGADVVWSDLSDVDAVVDVLAPARDEAAG